MSKQHPWERKTVWRQKDGKDIKIKDMDDQS